MQSFAKLTCLGKNIKCPWDEAFTSLFLDFYLSHVRRTFVKSIRKLLRFVCVASKVSQSAVVLQQKHFVKDILLQINRTFRRTTLATIHTVTKDSACNWKPTRIIWYRLLLIVNDLFLHTLSNLSILNSSTLKRERFELIPVHLPALENNRSRHSRGKKLHTGTMQTRKQNEKKWKWIPVWKYKELRSRLRSNISVGRFGTK